MIYEIEKSGLVLPATGTLASDKAPTTERLYHHLAILARPNALQQLFYYAKCLCFVVPFTPPRESILTLFEPVSDAHSASGPA
jgi:hypothetical protein